MKNIIYIILITIISVFCIQCNQNSDRTQSVTEIERQKQLIDLENLRNDLDEQIKILSQNNEKPEDETIRDFQTALQGFDTGRVSIRDYVVYSRIDNDIQNPGFRLLNVRFSFDGYEGAEMRSPGNSGNESKFHKLKFTFDYISCNLDDASRGTKIEKGCEIDLTYFNFIVRTGDYVRNLVFLNQDYEFYAYIDLLKNHTVYVLMLDDIWNELNKSIGNDTPVRFDIIEKHGFQRFNSIGYKSY